MTRLRGLDAATAEADTVDVSLGVRLIRDHRRDRRRTGVEGADPRFDRGSAVAADVELVGQIEAEEKR
jgi:hypothetical protein